MNRIPLKFEPFFSQFFNSKIGSRKHFVIVFYDVDEVYHSISKRLQSTNDAEILYFDNRSVLNQQAILEKYYDPTKHYLTILECSVNTLYSKDKSAMQFAHKEKGLDFVTFEFPRVDCTTFQIEDTLNRIMKFEPKKELKRATGFYKKLGDNPNYEIRIQTGRNKDSELIVQGPAPWMEIAGPLQEGDIRFLPGSELFYAGGNVSGSFCCEPGALNLLPLKVNDETDETIERVREFTKLGSRLQNENLRIDINQGKIKRLHSKSTLAADFELLFSESEAFYHLVEVGFGLSDAAKPLVYDWAATTNEAVAGVHVGFGADPGNVGRFDTNIHLDFVVEDARIYVNDQLFYDSGKYFYKAQCR